jgi:aspartate kinase
MQKGKVLKFGGTSMGSADAIEQVISILKRSRGTRAVVVSAMSGVTNDLIDIAKRASKKDSSYKKILKELEKRHFDTLAELVKNSGEARSEFVALFSHLESALLGIYRTRELSHASLDYVMSYGERLSAHILTFALNERGIPCKYLNTRHIVTTDEHFGGAAVDFAVTDKAIKKYFQRHKRLQIVTGFIGATSDSRTTTLGRGGSDYSAAIIGAALGVKVIEIWTDVSGIMTADPRLVPKAKVVPELAFEEAGELAYFGAKVLHPKTILPAIRKKIPVKVLNTFRPNDAGTTIVANFAQRRKKSHTIEALTCKRPVVAIHIQSPEFFDVNGFMAAIFQLFDRHRTSVDVVTTSIASVSVTVEDEKHVDEIVEELRQLGDVSVERGKAIICAVGGGVNAAGVAGRMFTVLGDNNISVEMISQEAGAVSITFVVSAKDAEKTLKVLHKEYIER